MMSYSRSRATFFISTTVLMLLSVITIILYSLNLAFISNPEAFLDNLLINFVDHSIPPLWNLPDTLHSASSKLGLAFGVLSLVGSMVCVVFAVFFWPDAKRTYPISPIMALSYALKFNALLSLITMIYIQVAYFRSSKFDVTYRSEGLYSYISYTIGSFDFESWACQLSFNSYKNSFPPSQCSSARGGRIAVILCCITAIAAAGIGVWALRGEKDTIVKAKIEKEKRRDYWVNNDLEMN